MSLAALACAFAALASLGAPAPAAAQVTVSGTLTVESGAEARTWYGNASVTSGSIPLEIAGSLTISAPVACTADAQCASDYCSDGYCAMAPPHITVSGPGNGDVTNAVPVQVCYSVVDPNLAFVEGTFDGVPITSCALAVSEGTHSLEVTATNALGGTSSSHLTFFIDRTPPSVELISPAFGSTVDTSVVPVVVRASDVWGVAGVQLNGAPMTLSLDGAYSGSAALQMGPNELVVTATDVAGNQRTSTRTVQRTTPPALTSIAIVSLTSSWRAGSTGELSATGAYSNGTTRSITAEATWASSNEGVARVLGPGVVQGLGAGTATILATLDGITDGVPLAVSGAAGQFALSVKAPAQGFEITNSFVGVLGSVAGGSPPYSVSVGGVALFVAPTGEFATLTMVGLGPVNIRIEATDAVGETASQVISGRRTPPAAGAGGVATGASGPAPGRIRYLHDQAGNLTQVIDIYTDVDNCGDLGVRCAVATGTAACQEGRCGVDQGGQFFDVAFDPLNCGTPGNQCAAPTNGEATCSFGVCGRACDQGYVPTATGCADLLTDPAHCGWLHGDCGNPSATCVQGRCIVPATPAVHSVNGVAAPGVAYRSPKWSGIRLEGTGLDNVTQVWLSDYGADSDASGMPAALSFQDFFLEVPFSSAPTSIVIPEAALQRLASQLPGFRWREWYRVTLNYAQNGVPMFVEVEVPVSLDDQAPAAMGAPVITGVAALRVRRGSLIAVEDAAAVYDPAIGYLSLNLDQYDYQGNKLTCAGKVDPTVGPPPVAVLAYNDVLMAEYPIYGITKTGVYLRAGLDPDRVARRRDIRHAWFDYNAFDVTLVYPYSNTDADYIDLRNDQSNDPCNDWASIPLGPMGGAILRGRNLVGDGTISLAAPVGNHQPGDLSSAVYLDDRVVIRPLSVIGDEVIERPLTGIEDGLAYVELDTPRGSAATPTPLRWLTAPVITGIGPANHVTYDQVMSITGHHFVGVIDVAFSWRYSQEHLTPSMSDPPGPGEYYVVDSQHVKVNVPSAGTTVPRRLSSLCLECETFMEAFPGIRTLTVSNALGSGSLGTNALDPASTPVAADPPGSACPVCLPPVVSGGSSGGSSNDPKHDPEPPRLPPLPPIWAPSGGCNATNTIGTCP